MKYLVAIYYVDPDVYKQYLNGDFDELFDFDYVCTTGLYIRAVDEEKAVAWGRIVAKNLCNYFFEEKADIFKDEDFGCFTHSAIEEGWSHCLEFFQIVKYGELPDFDKMRLKIYMDWLKDNKPEIYKSVNKYL